MTAFDLVEKIGRATHGTMLLVSEPFDACNSSRGGTILLPQGTRIRVEYGIGVGMSGLVDLDGRLHRVFVQVEDFHNIDASPR